MFTVVLRKLPLISKSSTVEFSFSGKDAVLPSVAWTGEGELVQLEYRTNSTTRSSELTAAPLVDVYPNPTTGQAALRFDLPSDATVKCFLFSAFGKLESFEQVSLAAGENTIQMKKLETLPLGIYTYVLSNGNWIEKGKIVKQ